MVTYQSSELGWEVTVELPADFLSLGRGSIKVYIDDMLVKSTTAELHIAHLSEAFQILR